MPRPFVLVTTLVAALAAPSLFARTHVWKGTESNLFSDPRNWGGGSPAADPEAKLVFPEAVRQAVVNDLDGLTVQRMTFEVDGYRVEGKAIAVTEGAEIESRDAVIAAELRLDGEVVQCAPGTVTRYTREAGDDATATVRADAEPSGTITFDPWGNSVDARVTPGAETAWLILSRFFWGLADQGSLVSDTDHDGVVRWNTQLGPGKRKVCVIDEASGEIHVAISDGSPVERMPFAAKFLRDTNGNFAWAQIPSPGSGIVPEILWVRPGVGAWYHISSPTYGGRLGTDSFSTYIFNVAGMIRIGGSPAPPAGIEPGDYFISMSFSRSDNGTFSGGRVDDALENAEHAETEVVLNGSSMEERLGKAYFFVLRAGSTDRDTRIEYQISDANPDDGVAYPPSSGTLVMRRGEVFRLIEYPIPQDHVYTGDTSVRVNFNSVSGGNLISPSSRLAFLVDDDPPPMVSVVSASVVEGDAGTRDVPVELKRTGGTIVPTTVRWGVPAHPMQTVVFAPGETRKEIVLQVEGDTVPEPNEEIRIDLDASLLAARLADGTLTVVDDDAVGITASNVTVEEGAGKANVTVTLDSPQPSPVTVNYQTGFDGMASPNSDYTPVTGTLTFAPGETEKRVVITILQDLVTEAGEYFELVLSGPSPSLIIRQRGRVTIMDDGDVPMYTMDDIIAYEGSSALLFLDVSPNPQTDIRVGARIVPGSATAAVDYDTEVGDDDNRPGLSVFSGYAFLYPYVFADDLVEDDETFIVEIYDLEEPSHVLASATVTVKDTTSLLPLLTIGDGSAREGKIASFPVTLSAPLQNEVKFRIRTVADTAEPDADFEPVSQLYTFAPGETTMTVEVRTLEDSLAEPHETFAVELLNPFRARLADAIGRGRIFDDDDSEVPLFAIASVSVPEGAGVARFTVTLDRAVSTRTTISFQTINGTAAPAEDFLSSQGQLTFEPGETSKTIDIALVNDERFEESETFLLRLANGLEATATILNDDLKPRARSVRH